MGNESGLALGAPGDEAEVRAYADIVVQALFWPPLAEDDWAAEIGPANIRLARRGGRVVAGLACWRFGQWFGGRSVPAAGLTAVAAAPEHRGGGVMGALLRGTLADLRDEGFPLAVLYPSTQPVYRRAGFEQAGSRIGYRLPAQALDARDRALTIRPLDTADHEAIRALYAARAERTAGNLDRNEPLWARLLSPRPATYAYLVEGDNGPEGYTVYRQQPVPGQLDGDIRALDLVALTPAAGRRLLTFFADHRSMIAHVCWYGAPADPLFTLVANQAHTVDWRMEWLLRVVDVRAALAARGYPPGLEAEVHLAVRDAACPWNDGRFILTIADGRGEVREGGRSDVILDARGLAALYSGYLAPAALQQAGLAAGEPRALAAAGLPFAGPAPWMPDMF
ncbi:MAG TPA: GNAT family N-acetyltransferase [Thermomicrobiales bacterium]|nr:GNAT family N-acetyltransferase [Thermomicrobiales bacterium]